MSADIPHSAATGGAAAHLFGGAGLGTFPFASPFTPVDDHAAVDILDAYFAAGGVYLDTAPTYAHGRVEEFLGQYLAGRPRESFAVSTSCGYVRDGDGYRVSGAREDVLTDATESLTRLGLDYVDVYISHIPDLSVPFQETAGALQELKDQGLARRIGVSNVNAAQLREYAAAADISIVQNRLSFLNRTIDSELQHALQDVGAQVVAYQVIERGLLTGRGPSLTRGADLRARKPEFTNMRRAWVREAVVEPVRRLAEATDQTVEDLMVSWVLRQDGVTAAQLGATSVEQARRIPTRAGALDRGVADALEDIHRTALGHAQGAGFASIEDLLGLTGYDVRTGSATGS